MADTEEVSLRPVSLRPGGAASNPFAALAKGAGASLRNRTQSAAPIAQAEEGPKKAPGLIVRYTKEFLLEFMDRYTKCPIDLQQSQLEIVVSDDVERDAQRQSLQRVAEEVDDRDWRTRAPLPPVAEGAREAAESREQREPRQPRQQQQQAAEPKQQQQQQQQQAQPSQEALRIQKAEDIGRQAYKVGGAISGSERALRQVKGILNKLTPEKFERLLEQLLVCITTADLLQSTITMVFENAVAQPTFCAMYADLCLRLSMELPSFPPPEGETKPISFKRVLLNTCQDEFEGAATAREELESITDTREREGAEKRVRMRTLGTVRLIAELYRKDVVKESITLVCIRELLQGKGPKDLPAEDNLESGCEMITITGKALSESKEKKTRDNLEGFMHRLKRLSESKDLPSRIRFIIRDVVDMSKNKWIPRRETFTAKKLDEVHAEAEAELGMVSSKIAANLPALPAQSRLAAEDFTLLPPLRGGEDGWEFVGKKSGGGGKPFGSGGSALVGEYKPPEPLVRPTPVAAPAPAAAAAPAVVAAPAKKVGKPLAAADVENKTKSFFREFASVGDQNEALLCVQEIRDAPKEADVKDLSGVVVAGVQEVFDAQREKEEVQLMGLLLQLVAKKALQVEELVKGLKSYTEQLEDLSLDVPKAPQILGRLWGQCAGEGLVELGQMEELLAEVEGAEPKRAFAAAAFKAVKEAADGEAKLKALSGVGKLLQAADYEGDLPSVEAWLKSEGYAGVVPL